MLSIFRLSPFQVQYVLDTSRSACCLSNHKLSFIGKGINRLPSSCISPNDEIIFGSIVACSLLAASGTTPP